MITLHTDKALSRHLLVRGLRYARESDVAKSRLLLVAEGYDASVEDRPAGYDSPWRPLALLFRLCHRIDLSDWAFVRAEQWFDKVLTAETENTVLAAARCTMLALCRSQAGKAGGISAELVRRVKNSLQSVAADEAESWSRHISINSRRLSFLARYYHVDETSDFTSQSAGSIDVLVPTRHTARELEGAVFALWGMCRLAVEVADAQILLKTLQRLWATGDAIALASQAGELQPGSEAEVVSLVRGYLAAIDFCEPSSDEAVRGLDAVRPVIEAFRLQRTQAIGDRVALLLARSIVAPTVAMAGVPEMVESISTSIATCVDATKRAGLSTDLISGRLRHAFLQFAAGDVRYYCRALTSIDDRIETLKHVCSAAASLAVHLDASTVEDVTALCVAGLKLPVHLLEPKAATRFGKELRSRTLEFSNGVPAVVSHSLQQAIVSECEKFFRAAAMEALSTVADPQQCTQSLRDSAGVFAAADVNSHSAIWDAAVLCLKRAPPLVFDSIVRNWILNDSHLEGSLWSKGWGWPNLRIVLNSLLSQGGQDAIVLASTVGALVDRNATAVLEYLFGESQEVATIMRPVLHAVVRSANPAVDEVLRVWLRNADPWRADRGTLVHQSVASLLDIFPEDSTEGQTLLQAGRSLASSKQAAIQSASQPHLAPVVAHFLRLELAARSRSEIMQLLTAATGGQELQIVMAATHLTKADAADLLELLCRDAAIYTFSELQTARKLALVLLERSAVQWTPDVASLFIRYAEPQHPQRWTSKSYGREGEHLHHGRAFEDVRSVVDALVRSGSDIASKVTAIADARGATTVWELVWLLADLHGLALGSNTSAHAYREACRSCLDAILTSEWSEATYWMDRTETRIRWRIARVIPAILQEVVCTEILEHASDVIPLLPKSLGRRDELRVVINAGFSAERVNNFETPVAGGLVSKAALPRVPTVWVLEG